MSAREIERGSVAVLVPDAQSMGGIAVIRSLGRAGYRVHALAETADALGLRSRFATASAVSPTYDDSRFLVWLRDYVSRHDIRVIIPSEGMLLSLRPALPEFAPLLPLPRDPAVLYRGMSKVDVSRALASCSRPRGTIPPSLVVERGDAAPDPARLGPGPYYVKGDAAYALNAAKGGSVRRLTREQFHAGLRESLSRYDRVLVQAHVAGQGVGVFFLRWQGSLLAEFMHRRIHEVPHTGGISSFRESWWHPGIRNDALAQLEALEWEGVAMMEYRWNAATNDFHFIEMNGRFWGSLHLMLYAGVDFPTLLVDAMLGRPRALVPCAPLGVRCRYTVPKELQYVWSRLRDPELSLASKLWTIAEFVCLGLDPRVRSDLLFPGDRKLYFLRLLRFARTLA
jgi:hypothetical protein